MRSAACLSQKEKGLLTLATRVTCSRPVPPEVMTDGLANSAYCSIALEVYPDARHCIPEKEIDEQAANRKARRHLLIVRSGR